MARHLEVLENKRGPTSILQFSMSVSQSISDEIQSAEFNIANLATVRLQSKQCGGYFNISLEYKKHELAKNKTVNMFVKCGRPHFSTKISCPEVWSSVLLGSVVGLCYEIPKFVRIVNALGLLSITVCPEEHIISNPLLYEDQDFTDFQLLATDGSVAVHKACLAARSDVFRRMFAGEWKETVEGGVEVKDVTKQTLQDMKDFIYLGKLPEDRLRPLIAIAKKYMIKDLVQACSKKLAEMVIPQDLYSLHEFACLNNLPELSCAITELTPDEVVHKAYEIKMSSQNAALKNDTK